MNLGTLSPASTQRSGSAPRYPVATRRRLAIAMSAAAAPLAGASPTGLLVFDWLWSAALAAMVAAAASHARRGPLLVAVGLAALAAVAGAPAAAALIAAVAAAASVRHVRRRAPFARGIAGGAAVVSLLAATHSLSTPVAVAVWIVVPGIIVASGIRHVPAHQRKMVRWAVGALVLFVVAATAAAGYGVYSARRSVDTGTSALRAGLAAARAGDIPKAALDLESARVTLRDAGRDLSRFGTAARIVPGISQNVASLQYVLDDVAVAAGEAALTAAGTNIDSLTVQDGRIDVDAIAALERPLRRLSEALSEVVAEIDRHDRDPLLPPLRDRLDELRAEASRAQRDALLGAQAADVAPTMLGADRPRRYLVLFTTPSEARGRFGFPGSFAEITLDHGQLDLLEHARVSETFTHLKADQAGFDLASELLAPYVDLGPTREFRSVTIPPDFPTVADAAAQLWVASGRAPLDGVLRFDPGALAALLGFTGPVEVEDVPEPLTSANLEQFLVLGQYLQFPVDQAPRREVLETVSEVTFERLEEGSLPSPRVLVDVFAPLVFGQRFQVVMFDQAADAFLDTVGMRGEFAAPKSDAVLLTTVNSTGNKVDALLERSVRYEAEVDSRGRFLAGTVDVELRNGAPESGLPFYVIGSFTRPPLPPGTNRTTALLYTAVPIQQLLVDDQPVAVRSWRTGGRWLAMVTVDIAPGTTVRLTAQIAGDLDGTEPYSLRLEPGGGARPDHYEVAVQVGGSPAVQYADIVTTPVELGTGTE